MATRTLSTPCTNSSDANFRAWINELNSGLLGNGWTAGTDTGQINFSTVTRPTAVNINQGFAIYKMGDSLNSTAPVTLRIDFGTGPNTDNPAATIKVALGNSDGAGGFASTVFAVTYGLTQGTNGVGTSANIRSSGSSSAFVLHYWAYALGNSGWYFAIERDHDSTGADTATGVNIVAGAAAPTGFHVCQFIDYVTGPWPQESKIYGLITNAASQGAGGNVGVSPVRCPAGPFRNPMKMMALCSRGDFTAESTTTFTLYGATNTYIALRPDASANREDLNGINTACGTLMYWN